MILLPTLLSDLEKDYISQNIKIRLILDIVTLPKKILQKLELGKEKDTLMIDIQGLKSRDEAKVTGGGILLDELDKNFQSKKVPGLYFTGEVLDIAGKTGGYNLQFAFSTGYICGKSL